MIQPELPLHVLSGFRDLLRPLPVCDFQRLEASILSRGIRDALVVWSERGTLLDGHHRYDVAVKHGLDFKTVGYSFPDEASARLWVIGNQLDRRNLTDREVSYYRGVQYLEEKKAHGGDRKSSGQNVHLKTAERLAAEHKVDSKTIRRDAKYTQAVNAIAELCGAKAKAAILQRDVRLSKRDVRRIAEHAEEAPEEARAAILAVVEGDGLARWVVPPALQSSESNEWYTPANFITAVRSTLGGAIDLDPASCEQANETVAARNYHTAEDDGLACDWRGTVWLNPPYGRDEDNRSNQGVWSGRLVDEFTAGNVTAACLLVNAVTDRSWFHRLWNFPICFVYKRIRFASPGGDKSAPTHGSVIVYLGDDREGFADNFAGFGHIVMPSPAPVLA